MCNTALNLPDDILCHILQAFFRDHHQLYQCSLVSWSFNRAASSFLYAQVVYSPRFNPILNLKDRGDVPESSMLRSACLPRDGGLKLTLFVELTGYLTTRPPLTSPLATTIANAIRSFTNVSRITFAPSVYHQDVFVESIQLLSKGTARHLSELSVNQSCTGSTSSCELLTKVNRLHCLTLSNPGRAVLNNLPTWLRSLSDTLTGLHLKDNCGSITPGVLTSLIPSIHDRLREFTLGLSYSLTDKDVFSFLEQLPCLESLQLQYYLQLRSPRKVNLPTLKRLTVNHATMQAKPDVVHICRWIKAVTSASPLTHLRVVCDGSDANVTGVNIPFDTLIDDLVKKHSKTLRCLDMRSAYISVAAAKALFTTCLELEDFHIAAREGVIDTLIECLPQMRQLHSAALVICNKRQKRGIVNQELAARIISAGPSLRRLATNRSEWEGTWISRDSGDVCFEVVAVSDRSNST